MHIGLQQPRIFSSTSIVFVLLFFWMLSGCSGPANSLQKSLDQNADFLVEQAESHWEQRDQEENARRALLFWSKALLIYPNDTELTVNFSHASFFVAHYWEQDPRQQDSLLSAGIDRAERLLFPPVSADTSGAISEDSITAQIVRIEHLPEDRLILLYWWAKNRIHRLIQKPVVERMNERELIEAALHRILTANPTYDNGGIYRLFGTFYSRLPGVDLERVEAYFKQAREAYPSCFATVVQQAQFLDTKAGNRDRFHEELSWVVRQNPTVDPNIMPENLRDQELAKSLLKQESYLFE
ncbi:MAG: hypothetical protein GXO90_00740 [FCB group bacterium]|nr:hypothetical protein [FCB group bacterium]